MKKAVKLNLNALIALLLCAALAPPARAEVDALVRDALALSDGGQGRAAYDLLEPQEANRAGDPDFDTVFGIAANQVGEHARAILALERVMIVQPRNSRARAELGRAMFAVGDAKSARALLDEAKSQGAPTEVTATIDMFLRAIDRAEADRQSSIHAYVEAIIGSDSNVATGPASSNVAVPILGGTINFTLAPANVKQKATFFSFGAGANGRYIIDSRLSLIGGLSFAQRNHPDDSNFNNTQFALNGGFSYRANKDEYTAVLTHDDYLVSGTTVRVQNGLVAEWTNRRAESSQYGAYAQISRLHYPGSPFRDVNRLVLGGSYAQQVSEKLVAYGGLYLGRENELNAGRPDLGHTLQGLRAGGQMSVTPDWSAFAGLTYEHRKYGGTNPTFLVTRNDNQSSINFGANWNGMKDWRVTPQISYTRIKSNIPINDYDRTLISVTARREF